MYAAAFQPEYAKLTYIREVTNSGVPGFARAGHVWVGEGCSSYRRRPMRPATMNADDQGAFVIVNPVWTRPPTVVSNACSAVTQSGDERDTSRRYRDVTLAAADVLMTTVVGERRDHLAR